MKVPKYDYSGMRDLSIPEQVGSLVCRAKGGIAVPRGKNIEFLFDDLTVENSFLDTLAFMMPWLSEQILEGKRTIEEPLEGSLSHWHWEQGGQ